MTEKSDNEASAPELERYRAKRSADRTGEPFDGETAASARARPDAPRHFVIQQHAARRLHWDVRLQFGAVLRSWAVPRGPSLDPTVKRLAVRTEDHPLDYIHFEGVIPEGNYGAGAMIVWDRGTWTPLEPPTDDKILFELRGQKLRGVWTLVKTKGSEHGENAWLLIKKPDDASRPGASDFDDHSILSGLTVEELAGGQDRAREIREAIVGHAPRRTVDIRTVAPMLAVPRDDAFDDEAWLYELKYDGYRLLCGKSDDGVVLRYRSGKEATAAFPEVRRALEALPFGRFVLDGEVVVLDDDARPNFGRLQKRAMLQRGLDVETATREHPVTLYAFDLLAFDDYDTRVLPLLERKALLRRLLPPAGVIRYTDHIEAQGVALMDHVRRLEVEGIVAKRSASAYVAGRCDDWQKVRVVQTGDFVIVGYTKASDRRPGFGALVLGTYDGENLRCVGRVGTGFDTATLRSLHAELEALGRSTPAVEGDGLPKDACWVAPRLVAEIRYKHVTDGGNLRHPVFVRIRRDVPPQACMLPEAVPVASAEPQVPPAPKGAMGSSPRNVVLTNPGKVFWPEAGYTKRDLFEYYRDIAPWLLPYLRDRPLVLTRYPDGIDGKSFYQKNAPAHVPDWIRTRMMWSEHAQREIHYFVVDDLDALLYVANLGTIPLHVWGSRLASLQHPDWSILDLDPKEAPFDHVVQIAEHLRGLCEELGLPHVLKTSGATGLHVLVPLGRQCTYEQCRLLAQLLAQVAVAALPDIATVQRSMRARGGRVYIDALQNGHGRLLVSPFCVRPRPGAPVSMPLRWDELGPTLDPTAYDIRNARARMERLGEDPFASVLRERPDLPRALDALGRLLQSSG
ncbi:MAG: DNA ligase D [Nannocystaceae bacterium]|nr:DNA ligase D [bacterium]